MNRDAFFTSVRANPFGDALTQRQVAGLGALLEAFAQMTPALDLRWQAYMLGTTFHETARTMQPIEEIGKGQGRSYGHPAGPWQRIYDGRGDVQLTWEQNYAHATQRLRALDVIGADIDLERDPDLALRPDIAAAIMIHGMCEGWFTGRKLADYFNDRATDWVGARRIINGLDCADQIAGYARSFFAALRAAAAAADAPAPEPSPSNEVEKTDVGPVVMPPKPPVETAPMPAPQPTPDPAPARPPTIAPAPEPPAWVRAASLVLGRFIASLLGSRS